MVWRASGKNRAVNPVKYAMLQMRDGVMTPMDRSRATDTRWVRGKTVARC
jgi:hypothetical protein